MYKSYKKILFSFFMLFSFFFIATEVSANSVNNIEMDVYIDSNGNARITEVWNAYLSQGTEGYRSYTNLGNSSITNFSVRDDSGRTYEFLSTWNTNASFDGKAYKSGFHYISGGVELCWGISNYGNRTYILNYDINNFVTQYTDAQGIYFNFLNLDQSVDKAKITIRSDISFSFDNAKIWAFGNDGSINFEDGKIVLDSEGFLSKSQYMVGLIRFNTSLFNTSNSLNISFNDVYDSAMSDVDKNEIESDSTLTEDIDSYGGSIFAMILMLLFNPVVWVIVLFVILRNKMGGTGKKTGVLDFGMYGKIMPSDSQINYWREIPCNKDLERAYWVAYNYGVVSTDTLREGIIGSVLLKWIKDELITVSETKKRLFSFRDNNYAIDLSNMTSASNEIENMLFKMLKEAAGLDNILGANEFKKWCKKNYSKIDNWFSSFNTMEQVELEKQGLITDSQKETTGLFGKKIMVSVKKVNPQLREEAIQLKGLKKFLLDFSVMPEREYFEVHIWEEYLIFAQLLGIADKVEEQFSKIYPRFNEQTKLNTNLTTVAIRNMAYSGYKGYAEGLSRSVSSGSSSSSNSSGGGGSSYSSGGSSSGGSSGGGFR